MSQILKANQAREKIFVLHPEKLSYSLQFEPEKPTKLISKEHGECVINCLNCMSPKCMSMSSSDIECYSFREMSHEMNNSVCPANAISIGKKSIRIDNEACIGCGLCAYRCPVGAIYIKSGKATLNSGNSYPVFTMELDPTRENCEKQKNAIKHLEPLTRSGCMKKENDAVMQGVLNAIKNMSQEQQNILGRNALICLGCQAALSRQGDVYSRLDGFYENAEQMGVFEIETGADMLAVSRALLDDVAVVNARYGITPGSNHPLAIVLSLPNKRTDYWQVVKDIKVVTGLKISTLTFGALLLFLWNCQDVQNFDQFYIDVDNSSIREKVNGELGRAANVSDGFFGILENGK